MRHHPHTIAQIAHKDLVKTAINQGLSFIGGHVEGQTLNFGIVRNGISIDVDIVLASGSENLLRPAADTYDGYLGVTLAMWDNETGEKAAFKKPVITRVHGLGPAHRSRITSSQRYMTRSGAFYLSYLLDVRTITGVVFNGTYLPINNIDEVNQLAHEAYLSHQPLLLEIENWRRASPFSYDQPLERVNSSFYRLKPALSIIEHELQNVSNHNTQQIGDGESEVAAKLPNIPAA